MGLPLFLSFLRIPTEVLDFILGQADGSIQHFVHKLDLLFFREVIRIFQNVADDSARGTVDGKILKNPVESVFSCFLFFMVLPPDLLTQFV
ncbi:MAG: hypothetical protein ACLRX4_12055 [Oscillospiraceae bacterium]